MVEEEEEEEVDELEEVVVALDIVEDLEVEVGLEETDDDFEVVEVEVFEVIEAVDEVEPEDEEDDDFEVEDEEDALEVVEEGFEVVDIVVEDPEVELVLEERDDDFDVVEVELFEVIEADDEVEPEEEDALEVVDEESVEIFDVDVLLWLLEVVVDDENIFFRPVGPGVPEAVELPLDRLPLEVVDAVPLPEEAIMIDFMTVDVVILAFPEGTSATTALKTLNAAIGAAALTLYNSNRLPAPQYSSLLPGQRKLQSVSLGAWMLPAWSVLPQ